MINLKEKLKKLKKWLKKQICGVIKELNEKLIINCKLCNKNKFKMLSQKFLKKKVVILIWEISLKKFPGKNNNINKKINKKKIFNKIKLIMIIKLMMKIKKKIIIIEDTLIKINLVLPLLWLIKTKNKKNNKKKNVVLIIIID